MRFLQLQAFYPSYLNLFYSSRPELIEAPFTRQIQELVADGFTGCHLFAPYLAPHGFESHLVVVNNPCSQGQWAREHNLHSLSSEGWQHTIARAQIEYYQPDVLYLNSPIGYDSRFLSSLRWKPKLVMGWLSAEVPADLDLTSIDLMLTSSSVCRDMLLQRGARQVEFFWPGIPDAIWNQVRTIQPEDDVGFCGQWSHAHQNRNAMLAHVATHLPQRRPSSRIAYYVEYGGGSPMPPSVQSVNRGSRYGMEMYRALRAAKIGINAAIDMTKREPGSMRILEVTSVGCMLLTEHDSSLSRFLEPDQEVVTFSSHGELLDKIEYYLDHEDERLAIAERGRLRILREHSMSVKAGNFASLVKQSLHNRAKPIAKSTHAPRDGRQEQGETIERIFELLERAINQCEEAPAEALQCLITASSFNLQVPGLEHLRGLCYLQMGEISSARDALERELRGFPTNQSARNLLNQLICKALNG